MMNFKHRAIQFYARPDGSSCLMPMTLPPDPSNLSKQRRWQRGMSRATIAPHASANDSPPSGENHAMQPCQGRRERSGGKGRRCTVFNMTDRAGRVGFEYFCAQNDFCQ